MKFIRDIIAEKADLAEVDDHPVSQRDTMDPTVSNGAGFRPEGIDPVHMVASGSRSLSRADNHAGPADGDMNAGAETDVDFDEADEIDPLSDAEDTADPFGAGGTISAQRSQPSELFADIWTDDESDGPEPGQDGFAEEITEEYEEFPDSDIHEIPEDTTAQIARETNAEALMRTMYQTGSAQPEDQPDRSGTPEPELSQAAAPVEKQSASPFGRLMQRQGVQPAEPTSAPDPMPADMAIAEPNAPVNVPAPAAGRGRRKAGRVKTRLLGFGNDANHDSDLFASGTVPSPAPQTTFPVGWMVVISGPGRGTSFSLINGVSQIGRGESQAVRLDFGDNSISRENHAAVAYDPEQQSFFLGHGGKANLVRLNGNPVLSTEPLHSGAEIRIGETTLRFVGLCGTDFDWDKSQNSESDNVRFG